MMDLRFPKPRFSSLFVLLRYSTFGTKQPNLSTSTLEREFDQQLSPSDDVQYAVGIWDHG